MIETPSDILCHHANRDAVDSFIAYRKKHKRAALSERGAVMIAKSLQEINAQGGDASERRLAEVGLKPWPQKSCSEGK